jgi:thiol-disulfide isomerase/thioredoxin
MSPRPIAIGILVMTVTAAVFLLERERAAVAPTPEQREAAELNLNALTAMDTSDKAGRFEPAKEITSPNGFINTANVSIAENIGKNVVLLDFWTYSCINCQRTTPYLNAWHEKYKDAGLVIIGVHTPEFEFEKNFDNVKLAVEKYGIEYPVVLDNDYSTWNAYGNRYWPRKYLIDIDGYIVYDHIGEGAYEETERKIQEALQERAERLNGGTEVATDIAQPEGVETPSAKSPEIYFGAARNLYLGNGTPNQTGVQILSLPRGIKANILYMDGSWRFEDEYAENQSAAAGIVFRYQAGAVHFVAGADDEVIVEVTRDGEPLTEEVAGSDIVFENDKSVIKVRNEKLYDLVNEPGGLSEHTIELRPATPGLQAFTFTFG